MIIFQICIILAPKGINIYIYISVLKRKKEMCVFWLAKAYTCPFRPWSLFRLKKKKKGNTLSGNKLSDEELFERNSSELNCFEFSACFLPFVKWSHYERGFKKEPALRYSSLTGRAPSTHNLFFELASFKLDSIKLSLLH